MVVTIRLYFYLSCPNVFFFQSAGVKVGKVDYCSQCSNGDSVVAVDATKSFIWSNLWTSSIAVVLAVVIIVVVPREATTLVLPLLVVTSVGGQDTADAINPVASAVAVVISDSNFDVSSAKR